MPHKGQLQVWNWLACNLVARDFVSVSQSSTICDMGPFSIYEMKSFLLRLPRSFRKASQAHSGYSVNSYYGLLFLPCVLAQLVGSVRAHGKHLEQGLSTNMFPLKKTRGSEFSGQIAGSEDRNTRQITFSTMK